MRVVEAATEVVTTSMPGMDAATAISLIVLLIALLGVVVNLTNLLVKFKNEITIALGEIKSDVAKTDKGIVRDVGDLKLDIKNLKQELCDQISCQVQNVHVKLSALKDELTLKLSSEVKHLHTRIDKQRDRFEQSSKEQEEKFSKKLREQEQDINKRMVSVRVCSLQNTALVDAVALLTSKIESLGKNNA